MTVCILSSRRGGRCCVAVAIVVAVAVAMAARVSAQPQPVDPPGSAKDSAPTGDDKAAGRRDDGGDGAAGPETGDADPVPGDTSGDGAAESEPEPEADTLAPGDAGAASEPESGDAREGTSPRSGDGAPVAPTDTIKMREPAVLWQEWTVRGDSLSDRRRAILTAFFRPEMKTRRLLTGEGREELATFARSIGHHLVAVKTEQTGRGTMVVLVLEPVTLVRRVKVTVGKNLLYNTIFDHEITRRMRLRAGSRLERDRKARLKQFSLEEERIADYLRNEGYIEAEVDITDHPDGQNAVRLHVEITKNERYTIGTINVVGNKALSSELIIKQFRHGICVFGRCYFDQFRRQNLNNDLKKVTKLYQKRGYPAVRVRSDFDIARSFHRPSKTVNFTVIVNERRKIDAVFVGNDPRRFPERKLKSLLTFDDEGSYDDVEVEASAEAIRRYYQLRGYFEANVTSQRVPFRVFERIVFTINPGPRLRARGVTVQGNRAIPTDKIKSAVNTRVYRSSRIFGQSGGDISTSLINGDIRRIGNLYKKQGFADVRVRAQVSRAQEDDHSTAVLAAVVASGASGRGSGDGIYLTFMIEEGAQTKIEEVSFEFRGEHARSANVLAAKVGLRAGDPYNEELIEKGQDKLERYYFEKAHPHAKITVETRPGSREGLVRVVYGVFENHEVHFGRVLVQGNFKTKEWLILDELGFHPGQPLSLGRAESGEQNLRSSGLFSAVQVAFVNLDKSSEQDVNVLVQVEERYDYRLGFEVAGGFSSDSGYFGELGLLAPNFLGEGYNLSLRGQYGTELSSIEGKLRVPRWVLRKVPVLSWPRRRPTHLEAAAFWRRETTERFGDLTSFGTSLALSKLFGALLITARYDLRQRNREEDLVRSAGASDDLEKAPVGTRTGAVGLQATWDWSWLKGGRLDPLSPKNGIKLESRLLFAHRYFLGEEPFLKLGMSGQVFWKMSPRFLVTNTVRYDHGVPLRNVVLPEVERYFAGGDTTVRGYEEDRLATEVIDVPLPPLGNVSQLRVLPAGGNIRFIHSLDLQTEVWKLAGIPIASAIFFDTGLVTNSLDGFEVTDLRHAVGLALVRVLTPFVSVSIEWAVPLDPKLGDDPLGRLHFNLGVLR